MSGKKKRKQLFVDAQVQGVLVRQLIVHWAMACVLIFLYLFALETFSSGFEGGMQSNFVAVWNQYGMLFMIILVISPVFIYDSIKVSNRFVGPMISFRRALNKLANGEDPGEVNFRQGDFWKELATDLNRIGSEIKERREGGESQNNPELVEA